jgi:hypothetical protein
MRPFFRALAFWILVWVVVGCACGVATVTGDTGHIPKPTVLLIYLISGAVLGAIGGICFGVLMLIVGGRRNSAIARFSICFLIGALAGAVAGLLTRSFMYMHWAPFAGTLGGALLGAGWSYLAAEPKDF